MSAQQVLCGDIWGSDCKELVSGPTWSHDDHPTHLMMGYVVTRRALPIERLVLLKDHPDQFVRVAVSDHPQVPPEVLIQMANDPSHHVRASVAHHPNTPIEVLEKLATDEDPFVKMALAGRRKLPSSIREKLRDHGVDWMPGEKKEFQPLDLSKDRIQTLW